ncbi:hypothetical protein FS749_001668 [Ceratobasidium sp. UAMH 11750]|nr:hypothetical protein FS749_001668 [Ceratobasidium sp. UAMH 11750]
MTPFTDDPAQSPTVVFPNPGMQALSSVIHLFGVSALGYCFARRTSFPDLTWSQIWSAITWPRLCVILVLADSWVFVFLSGVLILGSGLSKDQTNCSLGIFACIALYAGCKMLTYAFLMEKVHIVWGGTHQPRLKSPVYRICLITMTPYVIIVMLMLLGRIAYIRPDGACIIGLKRLSSLSLLTYDLYINVFLTAMFIWPLARSKLVNPRLKAVATRTLVAAFAALTTSTLNIAILTVMHGQQLGWVCLGSCGTDVTVNAIVLFWVTSSTSSGLTYSGPQPTTEATTAIGHDPNQGRASPNPSRPNIRSPSAVMLSPVPRSPLTPNTPNPNLNEKSPDAGLLSPSAWKNRFSVSLGKNKVPSGGAEQRGEDVEMSPAPSPSLSPRREVWDDRETTSFVTVNSRDLEEGRSGAGFVTIGAPPASKKRASTRTRVVNGVEVSQQSRSSVLGRIFGTSGTESRERDMEVTVTITTQLDHMDGGSCTSLGMTSVGGGGNTICGKSEGGSIHRDVGAEKART